MILRFTKRLTAHHGPLYSLYKLILLITLIPPLISTFSSSKYVSTLASIQISDNSHVEISRSVEPQVLARLESQFLKLLGMPSRPPKKLRPLKVPKYLIDLYEQQTGNKLKTSNLHLPGRYTKTANTVRTFYHDVESSSVEWGNRVKFDLGSIPEKEKVTGAELRIIFNKNSESTSDQSVTDSTTSTTTSDSSLSLPISDMDVDSMGSYSSVRVLVNDVIKPPKGSLEEPIMFPIDSKLIDLSKRKDDKFWITLDVYPAVARWIQNPKKNHGLVIQVVHPNGQVMSQSTLKHVRVRRDASSDDKSSSSTETDPVLFTYSDDGLNKKQRDAKTLSRAYRAANPQGNNGNGKRRKNHRNKNRQRKLCARHKMFVDFTDVGWNDWIVAPPGYPAYHCAGECPFPMAEHLNATNHAVIQALVHSMTPQVVPPPCCVPTKYSSLSLLYTDSSDKIVLKNYNEMVVDACGCS